MDKEPRKDRQPGRVYHGVIRMRPEVKAKLFRVLHTPPSIYPDQMIRYDQAEALHTWFKRASL